MAQYVVELYVGGDGAGKRAEVVARGRAAAEELARAGTPVRFLGALFLPEDETCFCMYEAPSAEAASEASRRAELAFDRVTKAYELRG